MMPAPILAAFLIRIGPYKGGVIGMLIRLQVKPALRECWNISASRIQGAIAGYKIRFGYATRAYARLLKVFDRCDDP